MLKKFALRLLGQFELQQAKTVVDKIKANKTLALLSYLALTNRIHTRTALAGLLWGDMPEAKARGNLTKALGTLRQVVGDHLVITRQTVGFARNDDFWLDVAEFETRIKDQSIEGLQAAVQLYQGDFLTDIYVRHAPEFEDWVLSQQVRLKELAVRGLYELSSHFAEQDATGRRQAVDYTTQLLHLEPWREEAHRQLMELLAQDGQRSAALAQYKICQQILAEELDIEPGIETIVLYKKIRTGELDDIDNKFLPLKFAHQSLATPVKLDLLEMPEIGSFFGREQELFQLQQWIMTDACRLCTILGVGGMGKTSLAATFVSNLVDETNSVNNPHTPFQTIMWRSLVNAPPLTDVLQQSILFLSGQQIIEMPTSLDAQIRILLKLLQQKRCLIILDNVESILQAGERAGMYRDGYGGYGLLVQRIAQSQHQSCLLLTSRESLRDLSRIERDLPDVNSLQLRGLPQEAAEQLLTQQGLSTTQTKNASLIERYAGHPLALKLVAETIDNLYFGDVDAFLADETLIFADIADVLDQQFARISSLEQEIMTWLAIEREPTSVQTLGKNLLGPVSKRSILKALQALQGRSLLEKRSNGFTLQNVIAEYMVDCFIFQVCQELEQNILSKFNRYALLKAQTKDYIRQSQRRMIMQPIAKYLLVLFGSEGLEQQCKIFLDNLRQEVSTGYAGGNILNLLIHNKHKLSGFDFSDIVIRQAYLQSQNLTDVNFSQAELVGGQFTDVFGGVRSVDFSPDGQLLAIGTAEGVIRMWQTADWEPVLVSQDPSAGTCYVQFDPKGRTLAYGGADRVIRIYEIASGQIIRTLQGHTQGIRSICFSPDGRLLASGGEDQTILLWSVGSGKLLQTLRGHTNGVLCVHFSPDGQVLASGSYDRTVRLWEASSGQNLLTLHKHAHSVHAVRFSPNGQILASGGVSERAIGIWDISAILGRTSEWGQKPDANSKNVRLLLSLQGHNDSIKSISFSPDGQRLASSSEDQSVRLWDINSGKILNVLNGHTNWVESVSFSPTGDILATGSDDRTVRLWDVHSKSSNALPSIITSDIAYQRSYLLRTLQGHTNRVNSICFSPGGEILASGNDDQTLHLWDVATGQLLRVLQRHADKVSSICFSPDGRVLASGSDDQTIHLCDSSSGHPLQILKGHSDRLRSICFSPDGRILASGSDDQTIRLWNVDSGQLRQIINTDRVRSICFSPNGQMLASGVERSIRIWDIRRGQLLQNINTDSIRSICFSPNGETVVGGSDNQIIHLWNVSSGLLFQSLQGHTGWVNSVCFSPDGQSLVSGGGDRIVRLWSLTSGRVLQLLKGHTDQIVSVCFAPDGKCLASSSSDGTIKIWDIQSGDCLKTLRPDRPYERMNITGVTGLTKAQIATLKALGAVTDD